MCLVCGIFSSSTATLGNGMAEVRQWDARGRATAVEDGGACADAGAYCWSAQTLAPDGDVLATEDLVNGNFAYVFNDFNELTQAQCTAAPCAPGNLANYAYDRWGNRWSGGPVPLSFYDYNNRMDATTYQYDADGNLVGDGVHTYQYDAENRLVSVDKGATASYVYGPAGRRVQATAGGQAREYIYGMDGGQTILDGNYNLLRAEVYLEGRYVGTQQPAGGFVWAYSDPLGTVRRRSNGETDTSWPFGAFASLQNGVSQIHFTGKPLDTETGLDDFGARYYSPNLGRFMTPDWSSAPEPVPYAALSNPQPLNLYSYVLNNPVTSVDKDGHCYPFCTVIAGAAVGAIFGGAAEAILEYKETGRVEWNRIGNAALGGAVAGAVLGSAGPEAGLAARVGLGISGSMLGGIIDRAGDKNVSSKDVTSAENLSMDAVAGAVGPASEGIVTQEVASKAIQKAATAAIDVGVGVAAAPSANETAGVGPKAGGTCKEGTPCGKVAGPGALHDVTPVSQLPGGGL